MAPQQKKKKTNNSQRNKNASNRKNTLKENGIIQDEIILVITLAISVLLLLSNFNLCGQFGVYVSSVFFGLIGSVSYIIPFVIFFMTAFYISNIGNRKASRKLISACIFLIALAALIQMITDSDTNVNLLDYYQNSSTNHNGGGFIGGALAFLLCKLFDQVATYIILLSIMAISVILITGKAIFSHIAKKGKSSIKDRMEYQKIRKSEQEVYSTEPKSSDTGRRPAKTFVIDQTNPTTLKSSQPTSENLKNSVSKGKGTKKENETEEQELPILNFHHLFDEKEEHPSSEAVPTYEDELRSKFGDHDPDYSEPHIEQNEPFHDMVVEENETDVEDKIIQEEIKPVKTQQTNESTDVESLNISQTVEQKEYIFPSANLLSPQKQKNKGKSSEKDLKETALKLQTTLDSFGVHVTVTNVSVGPAVTRYELQPEQGVKVSRITSLADDIKLNLAASDIRIEAPIPGKAAVGIEVPNKENSMVTFRELIDSREFSEHASNLAFAVGKDIGGQTTITDIAKMPHLLIAGATGSGKSVCINTLIMSILFKAKPSDVRMIMVDPKVVELNVYNGIPHLLIPVVTDPKKASAALNWAVMEMTERYKKFADVGARDLKGYNEKAAQVAHLDDESCQKLPQIIIIIDELADLMMVAPGEVEDAICRLAQLARAAGIHLIIATQRPSVNVITGLIKANIPSRIAFAVSSAIDSRTIIDGSGAEKLLGKGDMLFFPSGYPKPVRIQGAFISDKEVSSVVDFLKQNNNEAVYSDDIHEKINNAKPAELSAQQGSDNDRDEYFTEAGKFIIEKDKASIGMLQRVYKIGFNRAARIMDQLSEAGVVGPEEGTKPRKVLMSLEQFEQYLEEY